MRRRPRGLDHITRTVKLLRTLTLRSEYAKLVPMRTKAASVGRATRACQIAFKRDPSIASNTDPFATQLIDADERATIGMRMCFFRRRAIGRA